MKASPLRHLRTFLLSAATLALLPTLARAQAWVDFHNFHYEGRTVTPQAPAPGQFQNPILAGMYPDPTITRVGRDFYLANSTFAWYPGIPIFHSTDLIHWQQLGSVLTRPSQLKTDGMQVSRGVFAPTLREHDGTFYMINTAVGGIGNFYVTATNPAGPWSDPIRLPEIDGIDPSFFFDTDGKAYIVYNGPPPENKPLYDGHRTIKLFPFDLAHGKVSGPGRILVNGGVDISKHPAWIEGPHLFHRGSYYYLIAAEGGTSVAHSEVVFRSPTLDGTFVPYEHNPILTQRDLPATRPNPIADTGHADFVDDGHGNWWAVFLGVEPYQANLFNTGRETFLLPVTWQDDWPIILPAGQPVPRIVEGPGLTASTIATPGLNGSFTWNDDFTAKTLRPEWQMLRTPQTQWWSLSHTPHALSLQVRPDDLLGRGTPSFLARRQQHMDFTTTVEVNPSAQADAGLALFQNEHAYYFFGVRGKTVFLQQGQGTEAAPRENLLQLSAFKVTPRKVELKIEGDAAALSFFYRSGPGAWIPLATGVDATVLSTSKAGGFVGTLLGPFVRSGSATPPN